MSFAMTPEIYARISSADKAKERAQLVGTFAAAFGVDAKEVQTAYDTKHAEEERKVARVEFCKGLESYDPPKTVRERAVKANKLGLQLLSTVTEKDGKHVVRFVVHNPAEVATSAKGARRGRGGKWQYFFDGEPLLTWQGGKYTSVKALLRELAEGGNAEAKTALAAQADPHGTDPQRWGTETRLNAWQAVQAFPGLRARITRGNKV